MASREHRCTGLGAEDHYPGLRLAEGAQHGHDLLDKAFAQGVAPTLVVESDCADGLGQIREDIRHCGFPNGPARWRTRLMPPVPLARSEPAAPARTPARKPSRLAMHAVVAAGARQRAGSSAACSAAPPP